jgi:iron(III) transport system permease protein
VYDELKDIGTNPFPYALVLVMLAASVLLYALGKGIFGRGAHAMQGRATVGYSARRLTGWRALLAALPFLAVIGLALLPHLGVVLTSFSAPGSWYKTVLPARFTLENYAAALGHSVTVSSIRNSLLYSSIAIVLNVSMGVAVAFVVVRSDIRGRGLLDAFSMAPLAVPGLVMAFGYLAISSSFSNLGWVKENPFWQSLLDVRANPTFFLVIAYAIRRLPYMVRAAVAGLQQTSVTLEEAAANLGARPLTVIRCVTVPLIMANLIAGALLAFAFCMLEVSDSIMLAQREDFYPITKTIYELFQLIGTGRFVASALGVWGMLLLTVTIMGSSVVLGKRLGTLFRV